MQIEFEVLLILLIDLRWLSLIFLALKAFVKGKGPFIRWLFDELIENVFVMMVIWSK